MRRGKFFTFQFLACAAMCAFVGWCGWRDGKEWALWLNVGFGVASLAFAAWAWRTR